MACDILLWNVDYEQTWKLACKDELRLMFRHAMIRKQQCFIS